MDDPMGQKPRDPAGAALTPSAVAQITGPRWIAVASVLVVVPVYFLVLFATDAFDTGNPGLMGQLDLHVARLFFDLRSGQAVRFFTVVTAFGNWGVIFLLAASASVILGLTDRWRYVAALWLVLIGNQTLVTLLKGLFLRPRPEYAIYRELSASFPSGHAAASVALYGFLTYVLIRERVAPRGLGLAGGTLIVGLVGFSRLVLGEHYLSDVIGGYGVGAIAVVLGICLTELRFGGASGTGVAGPRRRVWAVVFCTLPALWVIGHIYVASLTPVDIDRPDPSSVGWNVDGTAPPAGTGHEG